MIQGTADPSSPARDDPLARAQEAFRARRLGEAEGICRDIVSRDPKNTGALGIWAAVNARQGRVEQAVALFERALSIAPDNGMILGNLAELYGPEPGTRSYQLCATSWKNCAPARLGSRSRVASLQRRWVEASTHFNFSTRETQTSMPYPPQGE
jgi:tetratricopeptide (TPR) repeat protein